MTHGDSEIRIRFAVSGSAAVLLAVLFIQALAQASTPSSFDHPWHDSSRDMLMLSLAAIAMISALGILVRGSLRQRIAAALTAALPVYVVIYFIVWAAGLLRV
jgi:hypothetical protein